MTLRCWLWARRSWRPTQAMGQPSSLNSRARGSGQRASPHHLGSAWPPVQSRPRSGCSRVTIAKCPGGAPSTQRHDRAPLGAVEMSGSRPTNGRGGGGWLLAMTDWQGLRDVYGSAAGVPALLDEAASVMDWDASVWGELYSRLCHQGT